MSSKLSTFRTQLDTAIAQGQRTQIGIPLIEADKLDLKDAQAAPLIILLADIVEAACVRPSAVPMTHVNAA
jgi:hypothetical protein